MLCRFRQDLLKFRSRAPRGDTRSERGERSAARSERRDEWSNGYNGRAGEGDQEGYGRRVRRPSMACSRLEAIASRLEVITIKSFRAEGAEALWRLAQTARNLLD